MQRVFVAPPTKTSLISLIRKLIVPDKPRTTDSALTWPMRTSGPPAALQAPHSGASLSCDSVPAGHWPPAFCFAVPAPPAGDSLPCDQQYAKSLRDTSSPTSLPCQRRPYHDQQSLPGTSSPASLCHTSKLSAGHRPSPQPAVPDGHQLSCQPSLFVPAFPATASAFPAASSP